MKDKRNWLGPTICLACMARMVLTITPSMVPWTKRLRGWLRWRNRRSFCTKECLKRNREVFRLVLKCSMELKRIIMPGIYQRQGVHKRAKQCWELVQWLERCKPKASTWPVCPVACGLSAISTRFRNRTCRSKRNLPPTSLQIKLHKAKTNSPSLKSDNLNPASAPPKREDQLWRTRTQTFQELASSTVLTAS